jgi:hypothetical protein
MGMFNKLRFGWLGAILLATTFATPALAQGEGSGGGSGGVSFVPQSGFWQNPNEPGGRGVILEVNSSGNIFAATLLYDNTGRAVWYVIDTGTAADGNQAGYLQQFVGGQHIDGEYREGAFLGFGGIAHFVFDSPTSGRMTWPGGEMSIQRYDIIAGGVASGPSAGAPRGSWWYNAAENGRGYFLEAQGDSLYFAALMYDDLGQATWYHSRGRMVTSSFYQGQMNQPYGGQTMSGESSAPAAQNFSVGNITVQFTSDSTAVLTTHNGRQIPITRYGF